MKIKFRACQIVAKETKAAWKNVVLNMKKALKVFSVTVYIIMVTIMINITTKISN